MAQAYDVLSDPQKRLQYALTLTLTLTLALTTDPTTDPEDPDPDPDPSASSCRRVGSAGCHSGWVRWAALLGGVLPW